MTPEQKARQDIDQQLTQAGYVVQDRDEMNLSAATGVVVREYSTQDNHFADYAIFINRVAVGLIEAKPADAGHNLTATAEQSENYVQSGLKSKGKQNLRFIYESTGVVTHFRDTLDIKARSREVFSFHKPETLQAWLAEEQKGLGTLRNRLKDLPAFVPPENIFRKCQVVAVNNLEESFANNQPRAVVQMATGAGKTYTAITSVYRLLNLAKAKRVLFLVDTKNLGEQAESEFLNYTPWDDNRKFPELYNVRRLTSGYIPDNAKVCISTIQRMYSILQGKELDESLEEESPHEQRSNLLDKKIPKEVTYNPSYPPDYFDVIIIDECHRSIYNLWKQVLDYFDGFLVGLTATPDNRTFGFFNQNVVSEYTHEDAVADDVNVGRVGTYLIETEISQQGGEILKQTIEKRNRLSREKRWEMLDEDINYKPSRLDKDIVNESQIRTVIKGVKEGLPRIFPDRMNQDSRFEVPKTLIFVKTDSHADDIIKIIREEFGEGNEFCKKITYQQDNPKSVLHDFRNEYHPRIAVTVDMIATGTDVKPIECLVFMRDVRSKNYFEQMLGRATRTLDKENLQRVSPHAKERKLGYVLIDCVGVTKSNKGVSRQLERKPTASFKELMQAVAEGDISEDTLTSLAGRLIQLDKVMTDKEAQKFGEICDTPVIEIAKNLLNAFDEDVTDYATLI